VHILPKVVPINAGMNNAHMNIAKQ